MDSIRSMLDLTDRVALVTGGAGHIGAASATGLAELGADVAVLDRDEEACRELSSELMEEFNVAAEPIILDLRDEESVRSVPDRIQGSLGQLDVVVHCAAVTSGVDLAGYSAPFSKQTAEAWREALEVNLTSVFNLTQAAVSLLGESPHASIINIASIYGVVGPVPELYHGLEINNPAAYAVSKGGLVQLTRWLATTLAPKIRVNTVSPGGVQRDQSEEFKRRYEAHTPLGRMAREADVAAAVAFLASDMSRYITGQNLLVDGGWTAA